MVRPRKKRFVKINPEVTYFKPRAVPLSDLEEVNLELEELEAIRLKDLEGLDQRGSAEKMKISMATFQRILYSAHKKIADALTSGKAIAVVNKLKNKYPLRG